MEELIDELIKILSVILSSYEKLYELQKQQTAVIVAGDIAKLQEILKEEDSIITALGELERARGKIVSELCLRYKLDSGISLSQIASLGVRKEDLLTLQDKLKSAVENVSQQNKLNGKLVKQALDYIDSSMNAIKSAMVKDDGVYGRESSSKNVVSLFDRKV